jgi:hypothetical protein
LCQKPRAESVRDSSRRASFFFVPPAGPYPIVTLAKAKGHWLAPQDWMPAFAGMTS